MIERPFHPDEVKILRKVASPQFGKTGSEDVFGCLLLFFMVPLYGGMGYFLNLYMPLFWAVIIPLVVFIMLFFAWHYFDHALMTYRYGHAVVETVNPANIRIENNGNICTVTVNYGHGASITWTGATALMQYNVPETAFRNSLAPYAAEEGGEVTYKNVPLDLVFYEKDLARRWIQFEVNKATSRFWLENWSLGDYLRTEYNLIRSSKTGELLFVRLTSGQTRTDLNVTFKEADIRYIMPGEG